MRRIVALWLALAPAVAAGGPAPFPAASFVQLPPSGGGEKVPWRWPAPEAFRAYWEARARPHDLLSGRVYVVERRGIGAQVAKRLAAGQDAGEVFAWLAKSATTQADDAWLVIDRGAPVPIRSPALKALQWHRDWQRPAPGLFVTDDVAVALAAPSSASAAPSGEARLDWVYATALLAADPPVYAGEADFGGGEADAATDAAWREVEAAMRRDPKAGVAALLAFPLEKLGNSDWRLGEAARFLADHGRGDRAIELYRRFRPVARCSMDSAPSQVAREYAALCFREGRIGCFLQLQVDIMGDQFPRMVYSSFGEAAHPTEVRALDEAGIDTRRFLRGLVLRYESEPARAREIDPWRLARAMNESGRAGVFEADLKALAEDTALDPLNRLRATQTLTGLWRRQERPPAEVRARLDALSLSPLAARWLRDMPAEE